MSKLLLNFCTPFETFTIELPCYRYLKFEKWCMKLEELSRAIINDFFIVYNELGFGFLESVYEKALKIELEKSGYLIEQQYPIEVLYKGANVGIFKADLLVNDLILLELKAVEKIHPAHEIQLVNYLKATNIEIGYVLNFGKTPQFSRKIFSNCKP